MSAVPQLPGYRDLTPLGRGGYSEVFRGHQQQFDRWVAVKVLTFTLGDDRAQRRFLRECQVAGRVSAHPHIATVYDAGLAPSGRPYLAMELYEGGSLADRLRDAGPLEVAEALRIAVALAGALESAHRAGVVHRDVKPGNVLLTNYGHPALTDFGLSILAEHQEVTAGTDALSPYHAPPEVLERARPTPVSDVYSLGSTTYTMLAGKPPHQLDEGESLASLVARIVQADVPPVGRPDVPAALDAALWGALARDPETRTPSALAFAQALQQAQAELGVEVTQPIVIDPPVGADANPGGDLPPPSEPPTPIAVPPPAGDLAAASAGPTAVAAAAGASVVPPGPSPGPDGPPVPPAPVLGADEGQAAASVPPPEGDETVHRSRVGQWPPPPPEQPPKKSRRGPLVVAALLVVAAVAGGAIFVATSGDGDDEARSANTSETTETTEATTTTTEATTTTTEATTTTTAPPTTTTTAPPTTTTTTAGPPVDLPVTDVAVPSTSGDANDACGTTTSYAAGNLTDGNNRTAWRMDGDGSGEWLTIVLGGNHRVRSVGLVPGYAKVDPCDGTDRFAENRRVTAVTWQFEDGTQTSQELRNAGEMQTVNVDAESGVVRLRIDGVTSNPGRDYTAISEISVRGN